MNSGKDARIPVTLLTGFLGSGKTTLLNHLVQQTEFSDTLVIINELGEIALDHQLVSHSEENLVMEMSSGCICCSIRGDLVKTLKDVHWRFAREGRRQFQRVIVETTGIAEPAPIVHTLLSSPEICEKYRFEGIVTTVDQATAENTLNNHPEAIKQVALADVLLLTKGDLVAEADRSSLVQRIQSINPAAVRFDVLSGRIDPLEIINLGLFSEEKKRAEVEQWLSEEAYDVDMVSNGPKRYSENIQTFCFAIDEPISEKTLDMWLKLLMTFAGPRILRVKGIINVQGQAQPTVIHGVQHTLFPPEQLSSWPDDDRRSRLIFITDDIDRQAIEKTFYAFRNFQGDTALVASPGCTTAQQLFIRN